MIVAENADERRDPASLTKLMTAYLAFAALRDKTIASSQLVTVSTAAWRAEGSRMFIEPRKAVTVDELLRGMIVQSGNDASIALAELVAGSEAAFAGKMNSEAARLGLANTHFENATGLSQPKHYSTAAGSRTALGGPDSRFSRRLPALLAARVPLQQHHAGQSEPPTVDRSACRRPEDGPHRCRGMVPRRVRERGERRRLAVVMGAASDAARAAEAQKLLNYGFQAFDLVQLYPSEKPVSSLRVWKGEAKDVAAGFVADKFVTLPKGKAEKLALSMTATEPLLAPVTKGQPVGTVKITLEGNAVAEFPLVALSDVAAAECSAARGTPCACGSGDWRRQ